MAAKHSLATAIRTVRKARGLSQEAFSDVSSRTYLSLLERDLKSPTMHKLTELCEVMNVHPLTLLTLAYAGEDKRKVQQLLVQVQKELDAILLVNDMTEPRNFDHLWRDRNDTSRQRVPRVLIRVFVGPGSLSAACVSMKNCKA